MSPTRAAGPESPPAPPATTGRGRAGLALAALAGLNLLAAADRWGVRAVAARLRDDLGLAEFEAGRYEGAFLVGFALACPVVGWLGDRVRRTRLMALGLGIWGLAALATTIVQTDGQLAMERGAMGAGVAAFQVVALTLLADAFGPSRRATAYALFWIALPLGIEATSRFAATGTALLGWRGLIAGLGAPALAAAVATPFLRDPIRGAAEGIDPARLRAHERLGASQEDYIDLSVNSSYTYAVFALAAFAFAAGGLVYRLPEFLVAARGLAPGRARGVMTVVALAAAAGLIGGGWAVGRLARSRPRALFVAPAVAMACALPALLVGLVARPVPILAAGLAAAAALACATPGPALAILAGVATPNLRAGAFAAALLAVNLLGDAWAPSLLGRAAEYFGDPDTAATPYGRALAALGGVPVVTADDPLPRNLLAGLLAAAPALPIAVVVLLAGARHLPRELALMRAKLRAAPVLRPGPRPRPTPPGAPGPPPNS